MCVRVRVCARAGVCVSVRNMVLLKFHEGNRLFNRTVANYIVWKVVKTHIHFVSILREPSPYSYVTDQYDEVSDLCED